MLFVTAVAVAVGSVLDSYACSSDLRCRSVVTSFATGARVEPKFIFIAQRL